MTSRFTLDRRLPERHLADSLRADVLAGLTSPPRTLPPRWFYDARGSKLFEEITRLPEYYPTRAEREILGLRAAEVADLTGARTLVELGSGSSDKTRLLIDALLRRGTLEGYAPIDVSESALSAAGQALCHEYPGLRIAATLADFGDRLCLPTGPGPRLVAFLGGTLGNLGTAERAGFYDRLRSSLGTEDTLLLGADLVKGEDVLVRAYDDAQGITAEFNKNVLLVLNRELGAGFDPRAFDHLALWNREEERVEMRLRARTGQTVSLPALGVEIPFAQGEEVRTEISVKFRRAGLTDELRRHGFAVTRWWTDARERFALLLAVPS
ncbi:L-histidine N(alpha)-methyltransferase [Streptomyces sp. CNQ085]|uniref:L-histidine N(alpha)-methyltransferase n=1 Tax=Streptomyces sp. CNQ085 TaxID=2886944 RepID=UPI001F50ABB0|nr:L-histidine N(alpha)-methyltransferase [Streptomyces sp. CNQ085]MCI0385270.1 L-histidine N(alpha)-methyltransferase [Streptomyces sp. CNQ085]